MKRRMKHFGRPVAASNAWTTDLITRRQGIYSGGASSADATSRSFFSHALRRLFPGNSEKQIVSQRSPNSSRKGQLDLGREDPNPV
ncbi:hypothetical protein L596_029715 [Steinernema carpocapsae]|uniref:Uncharacterized protein n=1 Tax=Steinernema carpocapsae TaxID=34508 RepID=A0A4U5LQL7_STECR|nr:hypothetical protein L596_029715 [Steinernema carpocapsae]